MIYIDFDNYDLEVKTWGGNGDEFDLHFKRSSGGDMHIDWHLNSYSSSFSMSRMCGSGYLSNVPVPATSTRIWKFSKDSNYFYIHCDGRQVARISRYKLSCISDYDWRNLGRYHGIYFDGTDEVSRYYRLSGNRCEFILSSER